MLSIIKQICSRCLQEMYGTNNLGGYMLLRVSSWFVWISLKRLMTDEVVLGMYNIKCKV